MMRNLFRLYQGYGRTEKEAPKSFQMLVAGILSYFAVVTFFASGFRMVSILLLFSLIVIASILGISESNYGYIFFSLFLLPLMLSRTILMFPGSLLALTFLVVAIFWYNFFPGPITVVTNYKIPEEATPVEAAFLLSRDIGPQELISAIFSLYLKGYLKVEEINGQVYFVKTGEYFNDTTLLSYEKFLLNKIFIMPNVNIMIKTGIVYKEEHFPDRIHTELVLNDLADWTDLFKMKLLQSLREEKPILKSYAFETKPVLLITTLVYLIAIFYRMIPQNIPPSVQKILLAENILTAFIFLVLAFLPVLPLTKYGKEIFSKVMGFREFMKRVEKPRLIWIIKEQKIGLFDLLNYLYALNLITPFRWVLDYLKAEKPGEEAILFTKLLSEVQNRWTNRKSLWEEEIKY